MQIQWYPGHMHKASKEIKETLPQIDLIIEVLDARIPFSSQNPMLSTLRGDKPCIRLLNKNDLADPEKTEIWRQFLEQEQGVKTLAVSTLEPEKVKHVVSLCQKMLPEKAAANRMIRTMIMGIPNVGKSTIINLLAGRIIAKTGNEPAVTKRQQRIELDGNIILNDTPGVLWANLDNKNSGYRLATTGAIKDTAISHDDVAFFAAEFLLQQYPKSLSDRFQIESLPQTEAELMDEIGKRRGCLRAGSNIDMDKTAKILLNELRSGNLGRLTLEMPDDMQQELKQLDIIREQKAAKKSARKAKFKMKKFNNAE